MGKWDRFKGQLSLSRSTKVTGKENNYRNDLSAYNIIRDVIFPFFSGIPVFSNQIDHPRESRRSGGIFLDQYRGVGVFIPRDKFTRIGLFRSVNRPFVASESRPNRVTPL